MDLMLDCNLVEGLFFFEHLTYEMGFESRSSIFNA